MLTEETKDLVKREIPTVQKHGLSQKEQERKAELSTKKKKAHDRLPKEEEEELATLLSTEDHERRRRALIHRLAEEADKYGRKEAEKLKREITDRVAVFSKTEGEEKTIIAAEHRRALNEAEKAMKAAMRQVQEQYSTQRKEENQVFDVAMAETRARHRKKYDDAELEMATRLGELSNQVGSFTVDIQELELDQLEILYRDGVIKMGDQAGGENYLVVPGASTKG